MMQEHTYKRPQTGSRMGPERTQVIEERQRASSSSIAHSMSEGVSAYSDKNIFQTWSWNALQAHPISLMQILAHLYSESPPSDYCENATSSSKQGAQHNSGVARSPALPSVSSLVFARVTYCLQVVFFFALSQAFVRLIRRSVLPPRYRHVDSSMLSSAVLYSSNTR